MVSEVFNFEVVGDRRCLKPRYVVYAVGQWDGHIMDWRGLNCQRCRVPSQPKFSSFKEARDWAVAHFSEYKNTVYGINGSHIPDNDDAFGERVLAEGSGHGWKRGEAYYFLGDNEEMNEEEWEDYVLDTGD